MDAQIKELIHALGRATGPAPGDIPAFLKSLPNVGALPSPWETWTLIGFFRHRERQYWVREVIQNHLRGDAAALGAMGALGHPEDVRLSGSVPGMPEWEYYFHGRGCCLTQKVTGERIDVDFWDETAEYFDVFFYEQFLKSLRKPERPEERLLQLHHSLRPLRLAVDHLLVAGAMTPKSVSEMGPPRIADDVLAYRDAIEQFCSAWNDLSNRVWRAALIGDWLAAHDAAVGNAEIQEITRPRAERCRAVRRKRLLHESGRATADGLFGLAELGDADDQIEAALRGTPGPMISSALEIIGRQDDPKWCPHVYQLFKRTDPGGRIPEPHVWITSLRFLLRHGYRKEEMYASLRAAGRASIGEAALLALEHAPEHALSLIRRALFSDIPCNRTKMAAILALVAQPWSVRELLRALEVSNDQEKTAAARAALLEIGDTELDKAVLAWEAKNPREAAPGKYLEINGRRIGPFYSMAEVMLMSNTSNVRYEMETLFDRVIKIKDVVPPEPRGRTVSWWKFWDR
jgi:hypothetical protein